MLRGVTRTIHPLFFVFATYIFLERVVTVVQWRKVYRIILF